MPCFSCQNFHKERGRNGERLPAGTGWCEIWDEAYANIHECRKYAPAWYNRGNSRKKEDEDRQTSTCFLTSACVAARGLPDDCEELTQLRRFRDEILMKTEEGRKLVGEYKRIAPAIVRQIKRSPERETIYASIYKTIRLCMADLVDKAYERATERYRTMVCALNERFCPNVKS